MYGCLTQNGSAMRMRLVYLTCTLLWLVMSALIGISFVSRSVFNAEQSFNAFSSHVYEQIGQKLQANDIVLGSFAAFCSQMRSDAGERAFAEKMQQGNRQIVALFRLDGNVAPTSLSSRLLHSGRLIPAQLYSFETRLQSLRQLLRDNNGLTQVRALPVVGGRAYYLLARAIDPQRQSIAVMLVDGQAMIPPPDRAGNRQCVASHHAAG